MQRVVHLFIRPAAMTSTETHTDMRAELVSLPLILGFKISSPSNKANFACDIYVCV